MTQAFRAFEAGAKGLDDHLAFMEPIPRRVRVLFAGEVIADSTSVEIMHEMKHQPVYYFPMADVRMDLMTPTDNSTT
jgi:uncharacterized protein (DUF427 family)